MASFRFRLETASVNLRRSFAWEGGASLNIVSRRLVSSNFERAILEDERSANLATLQIGRAKWGMKLLYASENLLMTTHFGTAVQAAIARNAASYDDLL